MYRNLHRALGGAALTAGAIVGLPAAAMAATAIDCTSDEVKAQYAAICEPKGEEIGDVTDSPGEGVGAGGVSTGGNTSGGAVSGGTTGGGTVSNSRGAVGSLPFTGDEILVTGIVGAGVLASGGALLVAGRRRPATA